MTTSNEKIIKLSKTKIILLIVGSIAFIGAGVWLITLDATQIESQRRFNSPLLMYGIGWICIIFFGLCGLFGIRKLFDKKPGLIFSSDGITDNSSGIAAGLIPWGEIEGFSIYEIYKQKMLVVLLKNPDKYIETGNSFKRTINRTNHKMCGSPLSITSNALQINFNDLLEVTDEYFTKYGNKA